MPSAPELPDGWQERDPVLRVLDKIEVSDDCWDWVGARNKEGRGIIRLDGANHMAYRVVYRLLVGSFDDALTLDHLCLNKACVRPEHLEPVTVRENIQRRWARARGEHA